MSTKAATLMAKTVQWGWLLLALLIALLFFLFGAGFARRRRPESA